MVARISWLLVGAMVMGQAGSGVKAASFEEGTRPAYQAPPAKSLNGKSIAEMKAKVAAMWPEITFEKDGKPIDYVVELVTDAGTIEIEFFPQDAPHHVRSFVALAKVGFFDGLIFHRCIPDFVIQGGCPIGNGMGGPGYCLKPEFNQRPHLRGVLSMARASQNDSAGSQFFICTGSPRSLDEKYTVFGKVTKGMEAVDKIVSAPRDASDRPNQPVHIKEAKVRTKF